MRSGYIFCNTTLCKLELLQDWDGGKNLWCLWGSWWMSKLMFGLHPFSFELRRVDIMGCICKIGVTVLGLLIIRMLLPKPWHLWMSNRCVITMSAPNGWFLLPIPKVGFFLVFPVPFGFHESCDTVKTGWNSWHTITQTGSESPAQDGVAHIQDILASVFHCQREWRRLIHLYLCQCFKP